MKPAPTTTVALFGECMLELQGQAFGTLHQGFGGDTLNTAVYLSRCTRPAGPAGPAGPDNPVGPVGPVGSVSPGGHDDPARRTQAPSRVQVKYATALGDDALSDGLLQRWAAEGIGLDLVRRLPGRMPGLYLIEVDAAGERRFHYWRDTAAARSYFDTDAASPLEATPLPCDWLYLSGISLAILPPAGRARLMALADRLRAAGGRVVFDNNYRPRLWPDAAIARQAYGQALARADLALLTLDDHQALLGQPDATAALADAHALPVPELVVKRGAQPTLWRLAGSPWQAVPTEPVDRVVDTTAAGDSFAAGYLARRLAGAAPGEATAFGNRLAARVIQHHGALIPPEAMADLVPDASRSAGRTSRTAGKP